MKKLLGVYFDSWSAAGACAANQVVYSSNYVGVEHVLLQTTSREAWVVFVRPLTSEERRLLEQGL